MSQCLVVALDRLLLDFELAPVGELIDCFFELHIFYLIVEVHKTKPPGVEASRVALYLTLRQDFHAALLQKGMA